MKTGRNIFETLKLRGVCFAVVSALQHINIKKPDFFGRDYFIVVCQRDRIRLKSLGFDTSSLPWRGLLERTLSPEDVEIFKENQDQFNKVLHNRDGRVYEQKEYSFKKHYQSLL
jgi:hypothetical protein